MRERAKRLWFQRREVREAAIKAAVRTLPATWGRSGDLDAVFGAAGEGRVMVAGAQQLAGVAVQSNGKIIIVGQADGKAVVVQLRPDGTQDPEFGTRTLTGPVGTRGFGYAVALQGDGKILVAGTTVGAANSDIGLWRVLPSGHMDESFGADGFASFGMPGFTDYGFDVAVDPQDRVLVAGYTSNGDDMIVVRFTGSGALDFSFNELSGAGVPFFQMVSTGYSAAYSVAVQPDGKILLTGLESDAVGLPVYRIVPGDAGAAVLDDTFGGGDGLALVDGLHPYGTGLSLQEDGGIVAVGMNTKRGGFGIGAVVRLTPAGVVDAGYGSATGVHILVPAGEGGFVTAVAALPSGGVAITGLAELDGAYCPFVAKLNRRGALDSGMGPGGTRLLNRRDTDVAAVAVQPDGRILVAGTATAGTAAAGAAGTATPTYGGVVYRLLGDFESTSYDGDDAATGGARHDDCVRDRART